MFNIKKLGSGILTLLSMFTASAKVHAALNQGDVVSRKGSERFDVPMLFDPESRNSVPMTPELEAALQKAIQQHGAEKLKNGIFYFSEDGQLEYLGTKSDLDNLRKQLIKLKLQRNAGGTTNCA